MNPEQATSAMNAALADFIAGEPSTTTTTPIPRIHHQENLDIVPLTPESLANHDDLSRNSRLTISHSMSTRTFDTSSSTSPTTVAETTTLPRYKTLLDKYSRNNQQSNSTNDNPAARIRNYFNAPTSSTNRRKRSLSNEYNAAKRFHALQSSTGTHSPIILLSLSFFFEHRHLLLHLRLPRLINLQFQIMLINI